MEIFHSLLMTINIYAVDLLELLLELEHEYGTHPEYSPALEDVLSYLQMVFGTTRLT